MTTEEIKANLASEFTDKELVEMYISNDLSKWTQDSINAAGELLSFKYGKLPDREDTKGPQSQNNSPFSPDLIERLNLLDFSKQWYSDKARFALRIRRFLLCLLIPIILSVAQNYYHNNIIDFHMAVTFFAIDACLIIIVTCLYYILRRNHLGDKLRDILKCLDTNDILETVKVCNEVINLKHNNKLSIQESFVRAYAIFIKSLYEIKKDNDLIDEAIGIFDKISGWHPDSDINYLALAVLSYQRDDFKKTIENIKQCRRLDSNDYFLKLIYSVSTFMAEISPKANLPTH